MDSSLFDGIVRRIRQRNREDYEQVVFSAITDIRIWIQENAEKAAVLFLIVGFSVPFLYKLVLLGLGAVAVVAFVVWTVALPPQAQATPSGWASTSETTSPRPQTPESEPLEGGQVPGTEISPQDSVH